MDGGEPAGGFADAQFIAVILLSKPAPTRAHLAGALSIA
ncbi:hypothetical protein BSU04_09115 [Caballeronia sordidicola]|uniref:Uncharacterized protein n=1 Tax=Caballeronia sordidicola TaxID=196367 RepID=A0A226X686_CABSO|nr:hypothetical protein BSU04_09115 [Caballeronia sordidicola]